MSYSEQSIDRDDVDNLKGLVLLEFGSSTCGHCLRAEPLVNEVLADHPLVSHIKIEDGRGKRLGRSFKVKLWPSLIFLKDGKEVERLVRPTEIDVIRQAAEKLS